jgi:hypothetical protein
MSRNIQLGWIAAVEARHFEAFALAQHATSEPTATIAATDGAVRRDRWRSLVTLLATGLGAIHDFRRPHESKMQGGPQVLPIRRPAKITPVNMTGASTNLGHTQGPPRITVHPSIGTLRRATRNSVAVVHNVPKISRSLRK